MRTIDADALKESIAEFHQKQKERLHNPLWESIGINNLNKLIDNAPTVEPYDIRKEGFDEGYLTAKKIYERPQDDKTEDDTPAGTWIPEEETYTDLSGTIETYTRFKCDRCLQGQDFGPYPFCPWCGKRMNEDGTAISDNTEDEPNGT